MVDRNVLIFGGTTEGRIAAERLLKAGLPCTVSVATHYGGEVLAPHPLMTVRTGRLDRAQMAEMMREGHFSCVIDATHPHAQVVSREIAAACAETALPCLRLERTEMNPLSDPPLGDETCVYVRDAEEAGAFLSSVPGHILVTTGSRELVRFVKALGDAARVTARILPARESLAECEKAGLIGKQIIAMQGPFDLEMNCAQIRHTGAAWLLTKETGTVGGYPDKITAAKVCGIRVVVIRRPSAENVFISEKGSGRERVSDQGAEESFTSESQTPVTESLSPGCARWTYDLEGTIAAALRYAGLESVRKRRLYLIGVGLGGPEAATLEAQTVFASAEVVFGAQSVLDNLAKYWQFGSAKTLVGRYDCAGILQYLADHPDIKTAAVAYSGDTGFFSGAAAMLEKLRYNMGSSPYYRNMDGQCDQAVISDERVSEPGSQPAEHSSLSASKALQENEDQFEVRVIGGISCVSYFASQVGLPWQGWKILSSHGRFCNVTGQVRRNRECFLLLSGVRDLQETGARLAEAQEKGMIGELRLIYGYELSRPAQEICETTAKDLMDVKKEGLYVLYIRHDAASKTSLHPGLSDSAFVRGKAPMTSSEIRALSLSRLGLTERAVLWDVGAGTGSVSVEAALACPEGWVWSVEFKREALELLKENRRKFCLLNMEIVEGRAPEALPGLPTPTHVFIGGSGGEIGEILKLVFSKNPKARVVVNCITSETLAALQTALGSLAVQDYQCIQVGVNREEMLGRYHYLKAGNPVFIISFTGSPA